MSSVISRTRIPVSAEKVENFFPYCRNTKAGNPINSPIKPKTDLETSIYSLIQHLPEIDYLDNLEPLNRNMVADKNYFTEFKPSNAPQVSAGERIRVGGITSSSGSHARAVGRINRKTVDCDYLGLPSSSFLPRREKERVRVKSTNTHTFSSSLGPCAEAEDELENDD